MHTSHDFIAPKFALVVGLVVFGQVRVWDRKSVGRGGCGQNVSNPCGCGHKISTRAGL